MVIEISAQGLKELSRRDLNEIVIPWTRKIIEGGCVTWDVPIQPSGLIAAAYMEQLKAIGKAVGLSDNGE
jgi:hypothetical protein